MPALGAVKVYQTPPHEELPVLQVPQQASLQLAHLLEQLQLLLVRVVQRLARILVLVERLVGLGAKDQRHALKDASHNEWSFLPGW